MARQTTKKTKPKKSVRSVKKAGGIDIGFLTVVLLLVVLGLIMVFSASYPSANYRRNDGLYFIKKQAMWAAIGFVGMIFAMKVDYRVYKKFAFPLLGVTLLLLGVVLFSTPVNGSRRWLGVGPITFQPSELAKLALIIFYAASLSSAGKNVTDVKCFLFHGGILVAMLGLLILEPHFSVCIIIGFVAAIMLLVAGAKMKHFMVSAGCALPLVIAVAIKESYRLDRLKTYLDPFQDVQGDGWQVVQSLYAIGSGGLFGLGFGNSRQKYMYVSEPQNDFIFAIICEELGMVGATVIIALFAILVWRGIKIALNAPDTFSALLVAGIMSQVGIQTFLNIAVVTKLIPTTGISLPFFSAGGSSLVFLMVSMGIVLNVSKYSKR